MWTILFAISIAQGLFLVSLIAIRASKNPLASRLISCMLVIMMLTNFGYLVARTGLLNYIPQFFGVPFGMMLLFGPLFYFYSKSVVENKVIEKFSPPADDFPTMLSVFVPPAPVINEESTFPLY